MDYMKSNFEDKLHDNSLKHILKVYFTDRWGFSSDATLSYSSNFSLNEIVHLSNYFFIIFAFN